MAYTVTKYPTVFGNKKTVGIKITADAATQSIETGLKVIEFFSVGRISMNSSNNKIAINSNASGVATPGTLGLSGFTSGDVLFITVYGR